MFTYIGGVSDGEVDASETPACGRVLHRKC